MDRTSQQATSRVMSAARKSATGSEAAVWRAGEVGTSTQQAAAGPTAKRQCWGTAKHGEDRGGHLFAALLRHACVEQDLKDLLQPAPLWRLISQPLAGGGRTEK